MSASPHIRFETTGFDRTAWQAAASLFLDKSLMQDWAFGDAKAAVGPWRPERGLFFRDNEVVGVAQVMIRSLPFVGSGLVWINRGPLWRKTMGESFQHLSKLLGALRVHWASQGYYLRVAPPIEGGVPTPEFMPTGTPGWASARVELSQTTDALRAQLQQKWRNALNKAERGQLTVSTGDGAFGAFQDGLSRFIAERSFQTGVTPDFIAHLQESLPIQNRMTAHVAYDGNAPVGGALIARYGDVAEYLAGFVAPAGHGLNVGQILLWRAMLAAKESGACWFDVGGMDERRTPEGIYHFKAGLGGTPYRLADEIEYCPSDIRARLVRWQVRRAVGGADA